MPECLQLKLQLTPNRRSPKSSPPSSPASSRLRPQCQSSWGPRRWSSRRSPLMRPPREMPCSSLNKSALEKNEKSQITQIEVNICENYSDCDIRVRIYLTQLTVAIMKGSDVINSRWPQQPITIGHLHHILQALIDLRSVRKTLAYPTFNPMFYRNQTKKRSKILILSFKANLMSQPHLNPPLSQKPNLSEKISVQQKKKDETF